MSTADKYSQLIRRLEVEAKAHPRWYRVKLMALAGLGFGYLLLAVSLALACSVGVAALLIAAKAWAALKIAWLPLVLAWLIVDAMRVRFSVPAGRLLRPNEAPELRKEVERIREAVGAPRLAGIVIDPELNAAAASVPRFFGIFGCRHYLVLGLPLLGVLSAPQTSAVIAHELGHISGGHGRFGSWIYRLRKTWHQVLTSLTEQQSAVRDIFVAFFNWYVPYFDAYSFVLARENEREADAVAARVAGREEAGQALVSIELASARLHSEFWPHINRLTLSQPEPPREILTLMSENFASATPKVDEWLRQALARETDLHDTHPALQERLQALGIASTPVPQPTTSAASAWLADLGASLQQRFNDQWYDRAAMDWRVNYQEAQQKRERIEALATARDKRALTQDELIESSVLTDQLGIERDPVPDLLSAAHMEPESSVAHFYAGMILLRRDVVDGIEHLERSMVLDSEATGPALEVLAHHYHGKGESEALEQTLDRLRRWQLEKAKS